MTDGTIDDPGSRFDRIESRWALRDLVSLYCMACDDHDLDTVLSLFVDDGIFRNASGSSYFKGRQAIFDMFMGSHDVLKLTYHWIHDHLVTFDGPHTASGIAIGHVEANMNGTALIGGFRYYDRYRRIGGKWLFEERRIEFLYFTPVSQYGDVLNSSKRFAIGPMPTAADYPENLPTWRGQSGNGSV